jgi:hypothetical protein
MDWSAPWWSPWRAVGLRVAARVLAGARVCDAMNAEQPAPCWLPDVHSGSATASVNSPDSPAANPWAPSAPAVPIHFVPQALLPEAVAYEAFIFESGQVPTRENLHDFFNGLAWLLFPHTKRRLNALQYAALAADGVQATRGALRDAVTLFDENAAIWPCPMDCGPGADLGATLQLVGALRERQWQRAFIELRAQWQTNPPVLFGHALLEKLVTPYKSITAHVYVAQAAIGIVAISDLDRTTAAQLSPAALDPKPFVPLPVLGVPGWWPANQDSAYYDDKQVFRAPRQMSLDDPMPAPKP